MRSIVSCAILLAACGSSSRPHDPGPPRDMTPSPMDLSGPIQLVEGPCPQSLNNARCLHLPTQDAGFYWPGGVAAGGSFDVLFPMTGPLPAGDYRVTAGGSPEAGSNVLQADLIYRTSAGDRTLGSVTGPASGSGAGGLDATISAAALDASPGDLLVIHVSDTGSGYYDLSVSLTIP